MNQEPLRGKTLTDLQQICADFGMPAFAAKQMAHWLYQKRVHSIEQMTNISVAHRQALMEKYCIGGGVLCTVHVSVDGTKKYLFKTIQDASVETVYIPDADRATLCVSSQAGCRMGCRFCMTAKMGFVQNLSSTDILNQIFDIPETSLTNLVFMGMGEPLDNWYELQRALDIITAEWGMAWSPQRVTLSTIGIHDRLVDFLEQSQCHLAVSVHSPFAAERQALVPMQKAYPIEDIIAIIRRYCWTGQRRVSFEYILFDKINDTMRHAATLTKLLHDLECRINLIRFHQIPHSTLRPSTQEATTKFQQYLRQSGIITTLRASRGQDIMAACGMLSANLAPTLHDPSPGV
jgi:23S rRNA (adenine2503-C2)-methyltransferase